VVATLVKKGYVEQDAEPSDRRATALSATRRGRALCARIAEDLVAQQRVLLQDLDPAIRAGVVDVIRRLAHAADVRFRAGTTANAVAACCAPEGTAGS
jgi:DNA-binding MarR family transcriptional regulator